MDSVTNKHGSLFGQIALPYFFLGKFSSEYYEYEKREVPD